MTDNPYGGSQPGYGPDPTRPSGQPQPGPSPSFSKEPPAPQAYGQAAPVYRPTQGYGQRPADYGQAPPGYGGLGGYPPAPAAGSAGEQAKGFLRSLFDFRFTSYITPRIVRVVYIVFVVMTCLVYLFGTLAAFNSSAGAGLAVLIFGALFAILALAWERMILEFIMAFFRMSDDTHAIRRHQGI